MTAAKTPHELLGVERNATEAEIVTAYRRLCMKAHPDRGGTAEAFQALKAAYEYALVLVGVCEVCNGTGIIEKAVELPAKKRRAMLGGFGVRVPCPNCRKDNLK